MIYLIQDAYIDNNDNFHRILKIGYTSNLDTRLSQYTSHNFGFKLLDSREVAKRKLAPNMFVFTIL